MYARKVAYQESAARQPGGPCTFQRVLISVTHWGPTLKPSF